MEQGEPAKESTSKPEHKGQQVAYVRVSTVLQNTDRQFNGLNGKMSFDRTFTDKASGKDADRPALQEMREYVRSGDTVNVWSIDRLARNLDDLRELVNSWLAAGISVRFHKEQLCFDAQAEGQAKAMQVMMLSMMGAFAEFELAIRAERQKEGVAIAKAAGKYKGRQKSVDRQAVLDLLEAGKGATDIAKELGIGRKTVYRIKAEVEAV
ncbi:recombinase family protein [uncultured Endozoicomonas sp.]|uniref:recombinase family protein n=1 Tax=uncultured Endozoicomonas sp. TaxID=432652 RepID=UPI0034195265